MLKQNYTGTCKYFYAENILVSFNFKSEINSFINSETPIWSHILLM